jgi:polyisoprenoid-binding protein YceI
MKIYFSIIIAAVLLCTPAFADGPCIVPGRGHFQIHVGTAGLFGAFAHDHLIQAQQLEGCASIDPKDLTRSSIKVTFSTAGLRVLDPKESAEDRAKVQKTMESEVLRIAEYPRITFESTAIERAKSTNEFQVRGVLTIRGKTQPVVVPVTVSQPADATYRVLGAARFKQTAFGIKPIQLGGGTVKVKDELRVDFDLFLK